MVNAVLACMRFDLVIILPTMIYFRKGIKYAWILLLVSPVCLITTSQAQQTGKLYIGGLLGISRSPDVTVIGDSNDRSSLCDEYINPLYAAISACTSPNRGEGDSWSVPFDASWGAFASAFIGYRFSPSIRVELEHVIRFNNYGQRSSVVSAQGVNADKLSDELFLADEWLGTVTVQGIYANLNFDLSMINGPLVPYVGVGIGLNHSKVDYGSVWTRSPDPKDIRTGRDQPNADEIAQNLAGVASSGHVTMQDYLLTFQGILGAEYSVSERVAFDFRARWMWLDEFAGEIVWDPLRGHVPNLRRDGSEPVHGLMSSDDFSAVIMSVGMKYYF